MIGFAVSCRTQLPDVSTRPGRNRDRVNLHGCLFILVAYPVCCCATRHSSSVCLAGSKGLRTHHANPTDLRNPCGAADALVVPRDPGIKPLSASTADASLHSDPCQMPTVARWPTCETCASGGFVIFWTTLCHTPPVLPLRGHTEFQDFRRNTRPSLSASAQCCPVTSRSAARLLFAKLEPDDCPCPYAVTVWRECRARRYR